jgi:ketosteroid isomerase-like protein
VTEGSTHLHRRLYAAFNARDVDALIALCDPGIVVQSVFGEVGADTYRGHEGVRAWQRDLEEAWGAEIRADAEAYFDLGERSLAFDVMHGRGRRSEVEVALPGAAVTRWRGGRCVEFKAYARREDALDDLNLSADALEPIAR